MFFKRLGPGEIFLHDLTFAVARVVCHTTQSLVSRLTTGVQSKSAGLIFS